MKWAKGRNGVPIFVVFLPESRGVRSKKATTGQILIVIFP